MHAPRLLPWLTPLLTLPMAHAQQVLIVGEGAGAGFQEVQDAVDAAVDGDALLVAEGDYAEFTIDGKSLSIFAVPGAEVRVNAFSAGRNLAGHQTVVLSGVTIEPLPVPFGTSIRLEDNQGIVRLQDCRLGQSGYSPFGGDCSYGIPLDAVPCVAARDCPRLVLTRPIHGLAPPPRADRPVAASDGSLRLPLAPRALSEPVQKSLERTLRRP